MKKSSLLFSALLFVVLFPFSFAWARQTVRVGVTDGPQAEIMQQVKKIAAAGHDLDLEIVPFREDEPINRALSSRRLDAASFQDGVALEAEIKRYGYPLLPAALTVTLPMGLYSRKARTVKALVPGASVALPRERGAVARALILLHNYGVIQLREDCGLQATLRDISKNPRKLRFVKLPAGRLAKKLDQVSLAAIDYPKAVQAGLYPARDGIGMEDGRSPYAGVLAIRAADKGEPWVKSLIAAYHSEEIKRFILVRYQDSVRRPW